MVVKMIALVVVSALLGVSGVFVVGTEQTTDNGQSNTTVSATDALTIDDFVQITRYQFWMLKSKLNIKLGGVFQNKNFFIDSNNTRYLLVVQSKEETEKELRDKLLNDTSDTICVDGLCLDREAALRRLEALKASNEKRLPPSNYLPFALMTTVFVIVAITGIAGNSLVISGTLKSASMHNSTSVFMCSLAVSDIFVLGFGLPVQIIRKFFNYNVLVGHEMCAFLHYTNHFSITISIFTMASISVERYIAICHPLKAKSYCTVKNAFKCVSVVWLLSLAVCVPVVFLMDPSGLCVVKLASQTLVITYYTCVLVVLFGIPVIIMGPIYWKIIHTLWKSKKSSKNLQSTSKPGENSGTDKMRKQVIIMLMTVLTVFLLCWGPPVLFDMLENLIVAHTLKRVNNSLDISVALYSIGIGNSCFNPYIYIIQSRQLRAYLKSTMTRCCKSGNKPVTQEPSESSGGKLSVVTKSETF